MDMKQILAAFDNAGSKPVTGTNDMKRFMSIIKENSQPTTGIEEDSKELTDIEQHPAADDPRIKKAIADKKKELDTKEEGIHNGLAFKDYFALEEAKGKIKGVDGKACWPGKRYAGREKKADGTYKDKCVPVKKSK